MQRNPVVGGLITGSSLPLKTLFVMSDTGKIPKAIVKFLQNNNVLTLGTCVENKPYCAHCFYIFLPEKPIFVIKSKKSTKHIQDALSNPRVAGTISVNTQKINKIRGLQYVGEFQQLAPSLFDKIKRQYYKKYPFALSMNGTFWSIIPSFMRLIDNRKGYGTKVTWEAESTNKEEAVH